MRYIMAFGLGFLILGLEMICVKAADTLLPLFFCGSATVSALVYVRRGKRLAAFQALPRPKAGRPLWINAFMSLGGAAAALLLFLTSPAGWPDARFAILGFPFAPVVAADAVPFSALRWGLWLIPLVAAATLPLALGRLFPPATPRRERAIYLAYAFFSGLSYVGLQALFLKKITSASGEPTLALIVTVDMFLLTSAAACFLIESVRFERPVRALRLILAALIATSALAYIGFAFLTPLAGKSYLYVWLAGALLFAPALCAGLAFGVFFVIAARGRAKLIPYILCANGAGSLIAGLQTKAIAIELGFSAAFAIMMLLYAGMAWLAPADPETEARVRE